MYTGNMVDELIAMVERAETRAEEQQQQDSLEYWYAVSQQEMTRCESTFAGVA